MAPARVRNCAYGVDQLGADDVFVLSVGLHELVEFKDVHVVHMHILSKTPTKRDHSVVRNGRGRMKALGLE